MKKILLKKILPFIIILCVALFSQDAFAYRYKSLIANQFSVVILKRKAIIKNIPITPQLPPSPPTIKPETPQESPQRPSWRPNRPTRHKGFRIFRSR